jgi:hypothetical protein
MRVIETLWIPVPFQGDWHWYKGVINTQDNIREIWEVGWRCEFARCGQRTNRHGSIGGMASIWLLALHEKRPREDGKGITRLRCQWPSNHGEAAHEGAGVHEHQNGLWSPQHIELAQGWPRSHGISTRELIDPMGGFWRDTCIFHATVDSTESRHTKSPDFSFDEDATPRSNFCCFLQDHQTVSANGKTIRDLWVVEFPDQEEDIMEQNHVRKSMQPPYFSLLGNRRR